MNKGQTSIEIVVFIAVVLIISVVFANLMFDTTDSTKSIAKLKLRTLDLITLSDSNAMLLKIEILKEDANLDLLLYMKGGANLGLSDSNYSDVISNILDTTYYKNVNLTFTYS